MTTRSTFQATDTSNMQQTSPAPAQSTEKKTTSAPDSVVDAAKGIQKSMKGLFSQLNKAAEVNRSLKLENQELKTRLQQVEAELDELTIEYSKIFNSRK